jgi:hypothetical protein
MSPSFTQCRRSSESSAWPRLIDRSVVQNSSYVELQGEFAQISAATVAPSRTTALAFWVAANARKGAAARDRAVWRAGADRGSMAAV